MASIGLGMAALISGIVGGGASIASGVMGSNAAGNAANEQVQAQEQGIQEQQQMFQQEQNNIAPYLSAGSTGISDLMKSLQSGAFGPGSLPAVPTAPGAFTGSFTAPTLAQAEQQPGYQFSLQQGDKGILTGASAAGGAISGGTLKSLDQYNQNLGQTDYNNVFNQSLQSYGAGLQGYEANLAGYNSQLAGYGAGLQSQAQQFQQLLTPSELGLSAAGSINQQGSQTASSIAQLMAGIGNSQAAGTVGSTNALTSGLTNATNSLSQSLLLQALFGNGSGGTTQTGMSSAQMSQLPNQGPSENSFFGSLFGLGPG